MRHMPSVRNGPARRRRKLEASPEGILKLLARSADGVFAVDADQRIVSWSAAAEELVGRSAGDVIGRYCYEVVLGNDYEGHPFCRADCPAIKAARRGRGVPNYDIACQKNGGEVWLNVSIVPVPRRVTGEALASNLGLSRATVRNHIQRLLAKIGVHSRLEAVIYGARHGLI